MSYQLRTPLVRNPSIYIPLSSFKTEDPEPEAATKMETISIHFTICDKCHVRESGPGMKKVKDLTVTKMVDPYGLSIIDKVTKEVLAKLTDGEWDVTFSNKSCTAQHTKEEHKH